MNKYCILFVSALLIWVILLPYLNATRTTSPVTRNASSSKQRASSLPNERNPKRKAPSGKNCNGPNFSIINETENEDKADEIYGKCMCALLRQKSFATLAGKSASTPKQIVVFQDICAKGVQHQYNMKKGRHQILQRQQIERNIDDYNTMFVQRNPSKVNRKVKTAGCGNLIWPMFKCYYGFDVVDFFYIFETPKNDFYFIAEDENKKEEIVSVKAVLNLPVDLHPIKSKSAIKQNMAESTLPKHTPSNNPNIIVADVQAMMYAI